MNQHLATVLATSAVLALGAAAPAAASSTDAFAELAGLKFQLVDTDLTDGITPYLTFTPSSAVPSSSSAAVSLVAGTSFSSQQGAPFGSVSGQATSGQSQVTASVAGNGFGLPSTARASGSSSGPEVYSAVASPTGSLSNPLFPRGPQIVSPFTLSANTTLTVTATATGHASLTQSTGERPYWDEAVASFARLAVGEGLGTSFQSDVADAAVSSGSLGAGGGTAQDQFTRELSVSFSNGTGVERLGSLIAEAGVFHNVAMLQPVPEPSALVMMGGGLAALVWLQRRRRSKKDA